MNKVKKNYYRYIIYSIGSIILCFYGIYQSYYGDIQLDTVIDIVLWPVVTINIILTIELIIILIKSKNKNE